jgi:selenocysteine-specific elongation factor
VLREQGVQTQTAECLVVGEILMNEMLLVLNKTDQIPEAQRPEKIEKMKKGLAKVFAGTKFKEPEMVPVSATGGNADAPQAINLSGLIDALCAKVPQICAQ